MRRAEPRQRAARGHPTETIASSPSLANSRRSRSRLARALPLPVVALDVVRQLARDAVGRPRLAPLLARVAADDAVTPRVARVHAPRDAVVPPGAALRSVGAVAPLGAAAAELAGILERYGAVVLAAATGAAPFEQARRERGPVATELVVDVVGDVVPHEVMVVHRARRADREVQVDVLAREEVGRVARELRAAVGRAGRDDRVDVVRRARL